MYAVSQDYKTAIQQNTRDYYLDGTITLTNEKVIAFTDADILQGSFSITNQCVSGSELEIGTMYAGELSMSLFTKIDHYALSNALIKPVFHLKVSNAYEAVPLGVFVVSEANRNYTSIQIQALDKMMNFDKDFSQTGTNGTVFELLTFCCEKCGVELALTKAEVESFPNGGGSFGVSSTNDIETYRDLLFQIVQLLCAFGTMDRQGKLTLKPYSIVTTQEIGDMHRAKSSFSDFITHYTAISSTNQKTKISEYYSVNPDDGLTLNLGINPLIQDVLAATRKETLINILNTLAAINYVPFDVSYTGNPALDLGDLIDFTGGHADTAAKGIITQYTWNYRGKHQLKGVGKNPRLAQAKSKNDKNLSGILGQIEDSTITIYSYTNASAYTITDKKKKVISLQYISKKQTSAEFQGVILLAVTTPKNIVELTETTTDTAITATDTSGKTYSLTVPIKSYTSTLKEQWAALTVTYFDGDNEITDFYPIETLASGTHILNLYYPLSTIAENQTRNFDVYLSLTGGTATIGKAQIKATISGQGLVSGLGEWDGKINIDEQIEQISLGGFEIKEFSDTVAVIQDIPKSTAITEQVEGVILGGFDIFSFAETIEFSEVIAQQTVDDKHLIDYTYDKKYVDTTANQIKLKTTYSYKAAEQIIDVGKLCVIETDTEQFEIVSGIEVV